MAGDDFNRFTRRAPGTGYSGPTSRFTTRRPTGGSRSTGGGVRSAPFSPEAGRQTAPPVGTTDLYGSALADARAAIGSQFDAEAAKLAAQYNSQLAGIGSGAGAAIRAAQEALADIRGNRGALKGVYEQYEEIVDPLAQEAIAAAAAMVGEVTPELEAVAREAAEGIAADYASAETAIAEEASRIGAGSAAARAIQAEATEMEAMDQADAAAAAEEHRFLLELEANVAETHAVAADKLDEGEMTRRHVLQDAAFAQMEEQAQAALAAARRAAAAAASRRRAIMAERNAALDELEAEKYASMKLNPHEAGEVVAINHLRTAGSDLDYNRQQLVFNTLSEAISQQVSTKTMATWINDTGLKGVLTPKETSILHGGLNSYTMGMRHQQDLDNPTTRAGSSGGGYDWRRR